MIWKVSVSDCSYRKNKKGGLATGDFTVYMDCSFDEILDKCEKEIKSEFKSEIDGEFLVTELVGIKKVEAIEGIII